MSGGSGESTRKRFSARGDSKTNNLISEEQHLPKEVAEIGFGLVYLLLLLSLFSDHLCLYDLLLFPKVQPRYPDRPIYSHS